MLINSNELKPKSYGLMYESHCVIGREREKPPKTVNVVINQYEYF